MDGKQVMNTFMSRAKITKIEDRKTVEVPFEKAPVKLKSMLQDSFDVPLCKLQVDEDGKVVKRTVVAGPGAKEFINNGMIANAMVFHPPFLREQDEWQADTEISMGKGGYARGPLTYKRAAVVDGEYVLEISGTFTNEGFKRPGTSQTLKSHYIVSGKQIYDTRQQEWVSGKLKINTSFNTSLQMPDEDKPIGPSRGSMVVSFQKLPGKWSGAEEVWFIRNAV